MPSRRFFRAADAAHPLRSGLFMTRPMHASCREIGQAPRSLAVRLAIVCGLFMVAGSGHTQAQTTETPGAEQAGQDAGVTHNFDIPAGPLSSALTRFSSQAGIFLAGATELTEGKSSPGLHGTFSVQEALRQLLDGSGLVVRFTGDNSVTIEQASEAHSLTPIMVYGRQKDDTVEAIPQSVDVYIREDFEITSAETVGDILRVTPNVSRSGSDHDMFADDFLIRGFGAEESRNGLGFRQTDHPTDLANVERIEVLKGPSSVLYGQMEPGGTINVVTKQPLAYDYADASVGYGSHDYKRSTLDVTGPLNDNVRARLNLAYQDSESFVDFWDYQRLFLAPNVTVDLADRTNLTVEGSYSRNEWTAIQGGVPIEGSIESNPNGKFDKSFNPAFKDSFTERDSYYVNARITQAVTDTIDARLSYSFTRNEADFQEYVPFGLNNDFRTLDRLVFVGDNTSKDDHEVILDLSGEFETGSLIHKFIVGANYRESDVSRPTQIYFTDSIDLFDPQYSAAELSAANLARDRGFTQDDRILAGFFQDRVTVAERWHLLAGVRYTDSGQSQKTVDHLNGDSVEKARLHETNWSTQAGLVYDLTDSTSLFANRSESFVPQQGTTSGLKPLDAEESTQYETGISTTFGDLEVNAAGFVIDKENIAISDPLDDDFEVARGEARSRGIELSVSGYVTADWFVNAAYGYTDTEVGKSDDPELEGNRFINVPEHTAALQSIYHISSVPGLSVGNTITYVDERAGDDENSFDLPSHTRVDLAIHYGLTDALQVDFMVDNVLDEDIFSPGAFDGVVREAGRTYQAHLKYFF